MRGQNTFVWGPCAWLMLLAIAHALDTDLLSLMMACASHEKAGRMRHQADIRAKIRGNATKFIEMLTLFTTIIMCIHCKRSSAVFLPRLEADIGGCFMDFLTQPRGILDKRKAGGGGGGGGGGIASEASEKGIGGGGVAAMEGHKHTLSPAVEIIYRLKTMVNEKLHGQHIGAALDGLEPAMRADIQWRIPLSQITRDQLWRRLQTGGTGCLRENDVMTFLMALALSHPDTDEPVGRDDVDEPQRTRDVISFLRAFVSCEPFVTGVVEDTLSSRHEVSRAFACARGFLARMRESPRPVGHDAVVMACAQAYFEVHSPLVPGMSHTEGVVHGEKEESVRAWILRYRSALVVSSCRTQTCA